MLISSGVVLWHYPNNAPTVYQIGDTDGDGVPNVVVFGGSAGRTSMVAY